MTRILYLSSSPRGNASYSNQIASRVLDALREAHPGASISERDLSREPLQHLNEDFTAALATPEDRRSPAQKAWIAKADALIDELFSADIIVIGVAMINFAIPSTLKSWIDHVSRAGKTFRYSPEGKPEGLLQGKRVIVVHAKGGIYSTEQARGFDFVAPYLRHVLGFLGVQDVQVIDVEGTGLGEEAVQKALSRGQECAHAVVAQHEAAA
jgi:FMN-dependent NADH-azoreductase